MIVEKSILFEKMKCTHWVFLNVLLGSLQCYWHRECRWDWKQANIISASWSQWLAVS